MTKEFSGNMSIVVNMNFNNVKANSMEEAINKIMSLGLDINLIDLESSSKLEIDVQEWDIIREVQQGNISELHAKDFTIEEEKEEEK